MSMPPAPRSPRAELLTILRLLSLRVEVDAHLDLLGDVLAAVRVVDVPGDLGARQHQLAGVRPHDFALLADGPFHEGAAAARAAAAAGSVSRDRRVRIANRGRSSRSSC